MTRPTLSIHWIAAQQWWGVRDSRVGWLRHFATLAAAEAWVIAEQERREMEPGATA